MPSAFAQPIRVHVENLEQVFNSVDPAPFHKRDLDPDAESFIIDWAKDLPRHASLSLVAHIDQPSSDANAGETLRESVQRHFGARLQSAERRLRALFQRGWISLAIGLVFLAASLAVGELLGRLAHPSRFTEILRESLSIGCWVAMWRPLEIFLYDWWPIRADMRLFGRLSAMSVEIRYAGESRN
jgi:hypothetical protein